MQTVFLFCALFVGFVLFSRGGRSYLVLESRAWARSVAVADGRIPEAEKTSGAENAQRPVPPDTERSREERIHDQRARIEQKIRDERPVPVSSSLPQRTSGTLTHFLAERLRLRNEASGPLTGSAPVTGVILNVTTQQPVPHAMLEAMLIEPEGSNGHSTPARPVIHNLRGAVLVQADKNGRFLIDRLVGRSFLLPTSMEGQRKVAPQHDRGPRLYRLPEAWPFEPDLRIRNGETREIVVKAFPGYTISGQVIDRRTGRPLPGARVALGAYREESAVAADEEGRFHFRGVYGSINRATGCIETETVEARHPGYTTPPRKPLVIPSTPEPFDPSDLEVTVTIELLPETAN